MIKFLDLAKQNSEINSDVERKFAQIHEKTSYIDGPQVAEFEGEFAAYLGVRRVIGVGSGTDALRLALIAAGIGPGDEVITVPSTFIATAASIIQTGATPSFVDIDPMTGTMDPRALASYLEAGRFETPNGPRALVPVHLYGLPAAMNEIGEIAKQHRLAVIEDACQAHGARILNGGGWKMAGALGEAGCFSFYPGKNLGAWGEAGAVATNDDGIAERVLRLRNHGRMSHFAHQDCGYNARLDTLQAAVLSVKLKKLDAWNARRREIAGAYRQLLTDCELHTPKHPDGVESSYHLFVIRSPRRDAIRQALLENQIECGIHYPVPLHLQPALRSLGYNAGDFPVSENWSDSILSLPMHPHMQDAEVAQVVKTIRGCLEPATGVSANGHASSAHETSIARD
jgi:dTDP-4-amino-4,6-dideoxygalactose transaminase